MKILFLTPYPIGVSPSQRFRFEQYFEILRLQGHTLKIQSFLSLKAWSRLYDSNQQIIKAFDIVVGMSCRIRIMVATPTYDFVFIHREASPIGPPIFEWIISKVFRKKIIYDFDDAIWLTDRLNESFFLNILKWRRKVKSICSWSHKISCGNEYLCTYASKSSNQVVYNPTTIDIQQQQNLDLHFTLPNQDDKIVIGWTGSHSTLKYLYGLETLLQRMELRFPTIQILIIADKKPLMKLKNLSFVPWNKKIEIEDLMRIDIGIMPLPDNEWTKGKCGFKALQYMALGIPAVASAVGVNNQIIENGVNGYLCKTEADWFNGLEKLITNKGLRKEIGLAGKKKVIQDYSTTSNSSNFLTLFSS